METELQIAKENAKGTKFWARGHKENRVDAMLLGQCGQVQQNGSSNCRAVKQMGRQCKSGKSSITSQTLCSFEGGVSFAGQLVACTKEAVER